MFVRWQIVRAGPGHVLLLQVALVRCCFFIESFRSASPGVLVSRAGMFSVFVENLSYLVVEGVGDKRNFEREECLVSVGFFMAFFVCFCMRCLLGGRGIRCV